MPAQVLNGPAVATHMYQALFGKAPSNALYTSYIAQIGTTDGAAFAASLTTGFATTTDAALATMVLANLGVTATTMPATAAVAGVTAVPAVAATATTPAVAAVAGVTAVAAVTSAQAYAALESALTQMFTGYGVSARGQIILNMTNLLANLEGDKTFGTIATTYNNQTLSNFTYASNAANTTPVAVTPADPTTAAGQTYTLTTGLDTPSSTSGNDTYLADNSGATKALTTADQINGGAGTDTVKVYLAAADTATGEPAFTSIETIAIVGGAVVAYTPAAGITSLIIDTPAVGTAGTFTLNGQEITLKNHTLAGTSPTTTIAAAATATATSQKVTVDTFTTAGAGVHTIALTEALVKTLNLVTTGVGTTNGSKFTLTNAPAALDTINVSGAGDVTVTEGLVGVKTINASTATGKVAFDVSSITTNAGFAFTGGAGNDTLTVAAGNLAAAALTSGGQLDFGAGTDTLVINDTAPEYTTINAAKNLEVVQMGVTAGTFNMASLTPSKVAFSTVAAGTVSNLEATDSVIAKGAMSTSLTVGGAVGNAIGTIEIGTATTAGFTIASLVTTGLTTINLASNGTNAAANVITAMTNSDNSNFVITGANDLTMAVTSAASITGDKVDATAFTGKLVVTGSALADIIIGGTGNDTITGGAKADTLTGGAGADTFRFNTIATSASADGSHVDKIKDFTAGTDKINFAQGAAALTGVTTDGTGDAVATMGAVVTNATSVGTLADVYTQLATYTTLAASAAAGTATVAQVYSFTTGAAAGTYLVVNDATIGFQGATDVVVNLTGLTGTVSAGDFTFLV